MLLLLVAAVVDGVAAVVAGVAAVVDGVAAVVAACYCCWQLALVWFVAGATALVAVVLW